MKIFFQFILFNFTVLLFSCNSNYTAGKKKGYFKIEFPQKEYRQFDEPGYPYTFEYPVYSSIIKDTMFFEDQPENPWWINIEIPRFAGRIYISYKEIGTKNKFDTLVNDAFKMAYKQHTSKASSIEPEEIFSKNKIHGIYFSLTGNTATANQFFLTDSTRHFLRGALYFDATPNEDSLGIVNNFLKKDLEHLINTLKWK